MSKQIKFKISGSGNPTIEAQGFVGTSCQSATRPFEAHFDEKGKDVTIKPEMLMTDTSTDNNNTLYN